MLSAEETQRRIQAARILRQISQVELDQLGHADGLGKQELSRLERGDLPLTRVRRDALARILRVPERWFLAEDVDEVVGLTVTDADAVAGTGAFLVSAMEDLTNRLGGVETALLQALSGEAESAAASASDAARGASGAGEARPGHPAVEPEGGDR